MREVETITFQFNIPIFTSFRGHRFHYQVHIETNIKLFAGIDEQSAKFTNNVPNSNK